MNPVFRIQERDRFRRIALSCLAVSIPLAVWNPSYILLTWGLGIVGLGALLPNPGTRRGACVGVIVFATCVVAGLLLAGAIGPGMRIDSPRWVEGPANVLGLLATWFASAAFLFVTPGAAPRILGRMGAGLLFISVVFLVIVYVWGRSIPWLISPLPTSIREGALFGGATLLFVSFLWNVLAGDSSRGSVATSAR